LLILFPFYCINNVSYATNWVVSSIGKGGSIYIDIDNITYKENRVTFWVKSKHKKPYTITYKNQIVTYDESKSQHIADCLTKKASTVISYYFLKGEYVYSRELDERDFTPIPPDSVVRNIIDELCEKYKS